MRLGSHILKYIYVEDTVWKLITHLVVLWVGLSCISNWAGCIICPVVCAAKYGIVVLTL